MVLLAMLHQQVSTKVAVLATPDSVNVITIALYQVIFKKEVRAIQAPVVGRAFPGAAYPGEIQGIDVDLCKVGLCDFGPVHRYYFIDDSLCHLFLLRIQAAYGNAAGRQRISTAPSFHGDD